MYRVTRGTSDILPAEQHYWDFVRRKIDAITRLYGYQRIDTPVFEGSRLFERSIGEETDIVEKEMYTFEDRGGEELTLRPEGTAPVCRAYIEHGMQSLSQPVRLYYVAPIFRYERPQSGRYRQHYQFGCEALGVSDPAIDAEIIDIAWRFYNSLGLHGMILYLNTIGCSKCRPKYLDVLRAFYFGKRTELCPDCQRRLERNPLRLLDCKQPGCIVLSEEAPQSARHLCQECADHLDALQKYMGILNLPVNLNHRLVRGLDYYTKTVFEIQPRGEGGAQSTIGGGGRYDNLIGELEGKPTPGVGFGTGIERVILNMKKQKVFVPASPAPDVFIAYMGEEAKAEAIAISSQLRNGAISATAVFGDRSLKAQLKQADALGSRHVIIIGDQEVKDKTVVLRNMSTGKQENVARLDLVEALRADMENGPVL